jgi:hypothetical protein
VIRHFFTRQFAVFLLTGGLAALVNFGSRIVYSHWMGYSAAILVAYLTGIRQTDLRLMLPAHVKGGRLHFTESKTGKTADYEITPTLKFFIDRALARGGETLFTSPRGLPWSLWGLQSALRRLKPGFQFRQLRPKAQTDAPDRNVIGHRGQMREVYTRGEKRRLVK